MADAAAVTDRSWSKPRRKSRDAAELQFDFLGTIDAVTEESAILTLQREVRGLSAEALRERVLAMHAAKEDHRHIDVILYELSCAIAGNPVRPERIPNSSGRYESADIVLELRVKHFPLVIEAAPSRWGWFASSRLDWWPSHQMGWCSLPSVMDTPYPTQAEAVLATLRAVMSKIEGKMTGVTDPKRLAGCKSALKLVAAQTGKLDAAP